MKSVRTRLGIATRDDFGVTLIEILVAITIFAIISVGLISGMLAALRMTDNSRDRVTAANLAAAAIDKARSSTNLLDLVTTTVHPVVDGTRFHVKTAALWVGSEAGATSQCNAGGGEFQYKSVNVSVTWDGMATPAHPVRSDTQIAPPTRVNDPDKGVIVASVRLASGAAAVGVKVKAAPASSNPNGAVAITDTPLTDAQGCAYFLNARPGNYTVSIKWDGFAPAFVDDKQRADPSEPIAVLTGSTGIAAFQFDQAYRFTPVYATNFTSITPEAVTLPTAMDTSFVNGFGIFTWGTAGPFSLHPFGGGYAVLAGKLAENLSTAASCQSIDPSGWLTTTVGAETLSGTRELVSAAPGTSRNVDVLMGVATVTGLSNGRIKAVAQTTGPTDSGDPGCATPSTYIYTLPSSGTANLALPFGSWVLTSGNTTAQTTPVVAASIVPRTRGVVTVGAGGVDVLTMDPREVVPTP